MYPRTTHYGKQTGIFCPYCAFRRYYARVGLGFGRCACGCKRFAGYGDDDPHTVRCISQSCGKVSERLSARVRDEREAEIATAAEMDAHIQAEHRPKIIIDRLSEIEREARYGMRHGQIIEADWQTHELAVEYRALMREWWARLTYDPTDVPLTDYSLTSRGQAHAESFAAGRRKLIAQAKQSGLRRFTVGGTEYRLWFDEPAGTERTPVQSTQSTRGLS